jgi:hypothetical protein
MVTSLFRIEAGNLALQECECECESSARGITVFGSQFSVPGEKKRTVTWRAVAKAKAEGRKDEEKVDGISI